MDGEGRQQRILQTCCSLVTEDDDRTRRAMRPPHPLALAAGGPADR
jgi:hypothetical protein